MADSEPSEEGKLASGLEEGNWRYHSAGEDMFSSSGSFVHGVMQGDWKEFLTYSVPANVIRKGDLRAQFAFVDGSPNGHFLVYDVLTGERVEGNVLDGFPKPCESIFGFDFGSPYVITNIAAGAQRGHDWYNNAPGGKTQQPAPSGKMIGIWTFYDRTGQLLHTEDMNTGNGHFVYWNSAGDVVCEGNLVDGQKDGTWTQHGPGGHPTMTFTYDHGTSTGSHSAP